MRSPSLKSPASPASSGNSNFPSPWILPALNCKHLSCYVVYFLPHLSFVNSPAGEPVRPFPVGEIGFEVSLVYITFHSSLHVGAGERTITVGKEEFTSSLQARVLHLSIISYPCSQLRHERREACSDRGPLAYTTTPCPSRLPSR